MFIVRLTVDCARRVVVVRVLFFVLACGASAFGFRTLSMLWLLRVRMTLGDAACRFQIVGTALLVHPRLCLRVLAGPDLITDFSLSSSKRSGHLCLSLN